MSLVGWQEFMENFRKAREDEEAKRLVTVAKKEQDDAEAEEVQCSRFFA